MLPEERDPARIWHMLDTARKAIQSLQRVSEDEFRTDIDARDLAVYRLQVIGEAANRVTDTVRQRHPEVPWREIVAKRNVLVHAYDRIDYQRVWDVIRRELPPLVEQLERILKQLDAGKTQGKS